MKSIIKRVITSVLFFLIPGLFFQAKAQAFNKAIYYKVMESGGITETDQQLAKIALEININKDAYAGALLMKKAGLVKGPSKKLNLFRDGHKKLEAAINKEIDNAEWHFLRLIIQENAPRLLNYYADKATDAAIVEKGFKKLSPAVQSAVIDYRKHSNTLQPLKFN